MSRSSQELLKNVMESNLKLADLLQKSTLIDSDRREKLNGLQETMLTCCEVDFNLQNYESCENELRKRRAPEDFENKKDFEEFLEDLKSSKPNVKSHEMYRALEDKIRKGESERGEDDLEVEESGPNLTCPVSKRTMTSPMTNKLCGHVYDKSSVSELLKMNKRGIRCPVAGCVRAPKFTLSDLEPNEALRKEIKQRKSKH